MAEIKRVTLHPLFDDGSVDTNVNLYPKTLLDGIVNREGQEVEVATTDQCGTKLYKHEISGTINFEGEDFDMCAIIISTSNTPITSTEISNLIHQGTKISGAISYDISYLYHNNIHYIIVCPFNLGSYSSVPILNISTDGILGILGGSGANITDIVTKL